MIHTSSDILDDLTSPKKWANFQKSLEQTEKQLKDYSTHKYDTFKVASTYEKTNLDNKEKIAWDMRRCGKVLEFAREKATGKMHLVGGFFCDRRLCPMCSFKRSVKNYLQIEQVIHEKEFKDLKWIFLTFTIRNCEADELADTIDRLHNAFRKMTASKNTAFRQRFLGWYRCTEITYNENENTYHPHIHVLACVNKYYFSKTNKKYMTLDELELLWQKFLNKAEKEVFVSNRIMHGGHRGQKIEIATKSEKVKFPPIDYLPSCKIEAVKNNEQKQISEVAKYTVKSTDFIENPKVLEVLTRSLDRKRCSAFGGLMKEVHQRLKLTDAEDDILDDSPDVREAYAKNPDFALYILRWNIGAKCYDIEARKADDGEGDKIFTVQG